ncbi:MAG: hypothetical protein ACRC7W_00615, partial [Fusobacteriaceae bacterium]
QMKVYAREDMDSKNFSLQNVISGRGYIPQKSWQPVEFNLTSTEIAGLRELICRGCRSETYNAFDRHAAAGFKDLPSIGLMDRVMFHNGRWKFVSAQSFPEEMAAVRRHFRNN